MELWLVEFLQTPQYSVAAVCGYYWDININNINEGRELRKVRRRRDRRVKVVLSLHRKKWRQSSQILLQGGHQFWSCHQVGGLLSCGKEVLGDPGLLLAHLLSSEGILEVVPWDKQVVLGYRGPCSLWNR